MEIIREKISRHEITQLAMESFGDMVKAVIDIEREIMAIGEYTSRQYPCQFDRETGNHANSSIR